MNQRGFSAGIFLMTFIFIAILLVAYGLIMGMPATKMWKYWVSEGNFPQVVAISGIAGYLIYKFFDMKDDFIASKSAVWAMIIWFLILLAIKFLL